MQNFTDTLISYFEAQLDSDESIVDMCAWRYEYSVNSYRNDGTVMNMSSFMGTVLTEKRLYLHELNHRDKPIFRKPPKNFEEFTPKGAGRSFMLSKLPVYEFIAQKFDGQIMGYEFGILGAHDGSWISLQAWQNGPATIEFHDSMELAVNRSSAASSSFDFSAQLAELGKLHAEGVLTEEEFIRAKELFIGKTPDAQRQAEQTLRSLKQLHDTGVLSEAEYAAKKGQILSKS